MPHSPTRPATDRDTTRAIAATHTWVAAATLPLSPAQARTGFLRAAVTVKADTKVHIVDAYCEACRSTWESVVGVPCPARESRENEHLRGGPIGERKKRGPQRRPTDTAVAS